MDVPDKVKNTVIFLSEAIDRIHLPENISDVLQNHQLDYVSCAALNLLAAVMNCLSATITYKASKRKSFNARYMI